MTCLEGSAPDEQRVAFGKYMKRCTIPIREELARRTLGNGGKRMWEFQWERFEIVADYD